MQGDRVQGDRVQGDRVQGDHTQKTEHIQLIITPYLKMCVLMCLYLINLSNN